MDLQKQREILSILQKLKQEKEALALQNDTLRQENEKLIYQNKLLINKIKSSQVEANSFNKPSNLQPEKGKEKSKGLFQKKKKKNESMNLVNDKNVDIDMTKDEILSDESSKNKKGKIDIFDMLLIVVIVLLLLLQIFILIK